MASCKEGTRPTLFCPAFCPARKRMRPKKLMMGRRKHFHAFLIDFLQLSSDICSSEKKKEPLTAWRMNPNTHPPLNGKNKPPPLTLLVYSSFSCLPMSACTASRGANPSYKTLYIVPVTGMSTPRRCASRCTACVVLTPSATMHMDEAMSSRLSPAPRRSPT